MLDAKSIIYVKNTRNALLEIYTIRHMSYIDMAIWVSKDASGPKEHRPMTLNNFLLSLIPQNFKIMLFKKFLSIFF